jgi:hypothetical protein
MSILHSEEGSHISAQQFFTYQNKVFVVGEAELPRTQGSFYTHHSL